MIVQYWALSDDIFWPMGDFEKKNTALTGMKSSPQEDFYREKRLKYYIVLCGKCVRLDTIVTQTIYYIMTNVTQKFAV